MSLAFVSIACMDVLLGNIKPTAADIGFTSIWLSYITKLLVATSREVNLSKFIADENILFTDKSDVPNSYEFKSLNDKKTKRRKVILVSTWQ